MLLSALPPHILALGLTYLLILALIVIVCAAIRPQAIDAIIRLLEELYRLFYHKNKHRTHSMKTKGRGKK